MIDVTSKNLHIQLSASENITTYINGGQLQVIYGDNAKLKTVKAVNYIKSGSKEIAAAVAQGIENFNDNAQLKTINFNDNAINKTVEFDNNATKAINEAKLWAEQAQSSAQSMAQRDLSNLTAAGEAKFSAKQDVISDLATIRSGAALGATAVQPSALNGYATQNWVGQQGYITSSALTGYATENYVDTGLASKQAILVSGTNIKTINNQNILGSGDLAISSRNIGEIVSSTIPLTDAGLHLLDGALIQGGGVYADFVTYIAGLVNTYPDLFETEANWQTSVTNYGVCGKFVYDSVNNTVRLPKITGFIEGTTDVTALGDLIQAGLPNITDDLHVHWRDYAGGYTVDPETNTVFYYNGYTAKTSYPNVNGQSSGSYPHDFKVSFDLSRGNPIYGNSNTVQPQAIKVLYYICIATSTKTEIEVDIDQIATDLNGKADVDLSNCTKPHIVETYVNGTSWYRVYSDGWCEQGGYKSSIPNNSTSTISLLKSFSNTNYSVLATVNWTGAYGNHIAVTNKQTSTFQLFNYRSSGSDSNSLDATWYACGYIS